MSDYNDSSSHEGSSLSSDSEGEQQTNAGTSNEGELGTRRKSKQLQYYYRKTAETTKRKYTPFADQENPSKQLKSYHAMKESASEALPTERGDNTDADDENDNTDDEHEGVFDYFEAESDEPNATSSSDDLSALTSSDSMSESEGTEEDKQEPVCEEENETGSTEKEEPLYEGSKISKVLSFVLIVAFVLKHNLSKAAWADLLRLLTALLGEQCKKTFQSVYKMKLFMKGFFGSKEPTKIDYCANCFNRVKTDATMPVVEVQQFPAF